MNNIFTLFLFFLTGLGISAQPNIEWSNTYGGSFGDIPHSVLALPEGGYLIAGLSMSESNNISNTGQGDGWLVRIDGEGNLVWQQNYGGAFQDEFKKIIPANDGGFLVAGYRSIQSAANNIQEITSDFWVIKINASGNLVWEQNFGGAGSESIVDIISTNNGYLLLGNSNSPGFASAGYRGKTDPVLLKINNEGQQQWIRRWGGDQNDFATGLYVLNNGRIVVSGYADSKYNNHHGAMDGWLSYLNANGQLVWSKFYGGSLDDQLLSVTAGPDNQIYAAGFSYSGDQDLTENAGRKDAWLIKVNTTGDLSWSSRYGGEGHDAFNKISVKDNTVYAAGYLWSSEEVTHPTMGLKDSWLTNIDSNGNINWEATYGGNLSEELLTFDFAEDNSLLLAGPTQTKYNGMVEQNNGLEDFFLIRLEGTQTTDFTVNLGADRTICSGASVNLAANTANCSGCTITWEDQTTSTTRTVAPITTTTYSVTVINADGISVEDEITIFVSQNPELEINLTGDNPCPGDLIILSPDVQNCAGCSYDWNDGSTQAQRSLTVNDDITYSLTVTNDDGCSSSEAIMIPVRESINFTGTTTPISCRGAGDGQISLNNNSGNTINFAWSNGTTGTTLTNLAAGVYTVTASANGYCAEVQTFTITEPDELTLSANFTTVSCFNQNNGSISTSTGGGVPPYNYNWSNGATSASLNNLSSGNYAVTLTDENGCSLTESFEITQPDAIQISTSLARISCPGVSDGGISITPFGGAGNYSFNWANGNTTNQLSDLSAGSYLVTVTDGDGCSTIASFLLEEPLELDFSISTIAPTNGNNGSILAVPSGGSPPYSLLWNTGSTSFQIINLTDGLYTVTVTDIKGCTGEESISLGTTTTNIDLTNLEQFSVFPNPNDGQFRVSIELENTADFSLSLINTLGQVVRTEQFQTQSLNKSFDYSNLPTGVYYLLFTDQKGIRVEQVVIE